MANHRRERANHFHHKENCLKIRLRRFVKQVLAKEKDSKSIPLFEFPSQKDRHIVIKVIWGVVSAICLALLCYQIYDRIHYYFEEPVAVDVFITSKPYQV